MAEIPRHSRKELRHSERYLELLQLGEMYFVVDGHHRVSAARMLGRDTVAARVTRI